jgi:hypothetical protein
MRGNAGSLSDVPDPHVAVIDEPSSLVVGILVRASGELSHGSGCVRKTYANF